VLNALHIESSSVSFSKPVVLKTHFKWGFHCETNKVSNHILDEELVFLLATDKDPFLVYHLFVSPGALAIVH
jgi:hypothetical protein